MQRGTLSHGRPTLIPTGASTSTRLLAVVALASCSSPPDMLVDPPVVTSVSITPSNATMESIGETVQLSATATDGDGNAAAGATITWTTLNGGVAGVGTSGLVTAAANGTASIVASAGNVADTANITVSQIVASVTVAGADTLIAIGDTSQFSAGGADALGAAATGSATSWSSSDTTVVRVSSTGVVTAVGPGSATITATMDGVTGMKVVVVDVPPGPAARIAFIQEDSVSGDGFLHLLDPLTGTDTMLSNLNVEGPSWSPDRSQILAVDADTDLWVTIAVATGAVQTVFTCGGGCPDDASWSPNGSSVVLADDVLIIIDAAGTPDTLTLVPPQAFPNLAVDGGASWSPAGDEIAFECDPFNNFTDRTVCAVDVATEAVRIVRPMVAGTDIENPAWSPDGQWIAYDIDSETIRIIRPDGTDETEVVPLGGYTGVSDPSWSPDGTQIAFTCETQDEIICVVTIATGAVMEFPLSGVNRNDPVWAN